MAVSVVVRGGCLGAACSRLNACHGAVGVAVDAELRRVRPKRRQALERTHVLERAHGVGLLRY